MFGGEPVLSNEEKASFSSEWSQKYTEKYMPSCGRNAWKQNYSQRHKAIECCAKLRSSKSMRFWVVNIVLEFMFEANLVWDAALYFARTTRRKFVRLKNWPVGNRDLGLLAIKWLYTIFNKKRERSLSDYPIRNQVYS